MIDYDFSTLNDKEFENLTLELISKERGKRFERFRNGRDGGIDGRYYHCDKIQDIVQCKHYQKTGLSGLISSLKKKSNKGINEINKVFALAPSKYIFITSVSLSTENKIIIKDLFFPYIKNDNDIYGQEDLNTILGDNPDIEKRYYKLWLSSTIVLDKIFNNAIESRSEFLLEDIKENSKYYVVTDNHNKAIEKLEESHIITVAGEPGIGKTTLAEHMAWWYVEKDFKFYNIENSINEAENIYKRDEKQIFYFDDFLGANYLNAIEDKKDSHIVKFMDRIKRDKTKRFILTSRTNIFNQGLALSDTFKSKNIESEEFIIKIDSLKDIDKAMILYNHIWHSDLDEEFINEIYIDQRYKQIISHNNFNPRLIEFITDIKKIELENIAVSHYWSYICDKLNNPQDVWEKAFEKDSDEFIRSIIILTALNGNKIEENKLRDAYNRYIELSGLQNNSHVSKEFDTIIKVVVKYFLNRNSKSCILQSFLPLFENTSKIKLTTEYSLFNPSIADFIIHKYKNNKNKLRECYFSLQSINSLNELSSLTVSGRINSVIFEDIVLYLYHNLDSSFSLDVDYVIKLLFVIENNDLNDKVNIAKRDYFFQSMFNNPINFSLLEEFVILSSSIDIKDIKIEKFDLIFNMIENSKLDDIHINYIIQFIKHFMIKDNTINGKLNDLVNDYLEDNLDSIVTDLTADNIDIDSDYDGNVYPNQYSLESYINDTLDELISNIDNNDNFNINKKSIINTIDLDDINDRLISSYYGRFEEEQKIGSISSKNNIDSIEDLFER